MYFLKLIKSEKLSSFKILITFCNNNTAEDLIIWDELWYWGFIGTKGPRNNRKLDWNLPKYISLEGVSKTDRDIEQIKTKTEEFINVFNE